MKISGRFIIKALSLALIADQAFEETQAPGASATTLLQPGNFDSLLTELATVAAPVTPAAQPVVPTPAAPAPTVQATS